MSSVDDQKDSPLHVEKHDVPVLQGSSVPARLITGESYQDADVEPTLTWHTWFVVGLTCLNSMGGNMTIVLLGFWGTYITADIGGAENALWLANAANLIAAVLGPTYASIGDHVGRKALWQITLVLGVVGCAVMASAKTMTVALVGNVIWSFMFTNSPNLYATAAEVLPRRHRATSTLIATFANASGICCILLGGAKMIQTNPGGYPAWRSMMWWCMAMNAICIPFVQFFYNPPNIPYPDDKKLLSWLDPVGTLLYAAALTPLLMGLIWGGATYTWNSAAVISSLVVGAAMGVMFIIHQAFFKADGIFHRDIFKNRNAGVCLWALAIEGFIYISFNDFYGEETAVLFSADPMARALRYESFIIAAMFGQLATMYLAYKTRRLTELCVAGFIGFLIGVVGLATVQPGSGKVINFYAAIAGFAFSAPLSVLISILQLSVEPKLIGLTTGIAVSFRALGGCVGPAIVKAVFTSKITTKLPAYIAEAGLKLGLPASSLPAFVGGLATGNLTLAESAPGVTLAMLEAGGASAIQAYADSLRYIWITIAPFIVLTLVTMFFVKSVRKEMNYIIEKPVEAIHHKHDAPAPTV